MEDKTLAFEDFAPGTRFVLPAYPVSREEVVEFARLYDPQPFHLDEAAATASLLGGLSASGWHTCGIMMRMMVDGYLARSTSQGASHVEFVKWLRPVRPGDVLTGECMVEAARRSSTRPELGMATIAVRIVNQAADAVMEGRYLLFLLTRGSRPSPAPLAASPSPALDVADAESIPAARDEDYAGSSRFWDLLEPGREERLGRYVFEEEDIVGFAAKYDPQYFHLDRERARYSLLGGLCASGWHITAIMMRFLVATNRAHVERWMRAGSGRSLPRLGPSPGARDLRWLRPVMVGDALTYTRRITAKRASESRPGWGIVEMDVEATDQAGRPAFSMKAAAFLGTD